MNERIFELAKQADLIQWDTLPSGARTPDHESVVKAKKFAELIVRECVGIIEKEIVLETDRMLTSANERDEALHANKVKHFFSLAVKSYAHFGVEE